MNLNLNLNLISVPNLNARDFWCAVPSLGQFFIVSGAPTFVQRPLKIQLFGCQNMSCLNPFWTFLLTGSLLVGLRRRRRKWQLSFTIGCWLFIYWYSEDLNKQFSSSLNRFLWRTSESQDRFRSSAATLARFFLVEIFWLADVCTSYRLLCVIGSEMNYLLSLKLHDPT